MERETMKLEAVGLASSEITPARIQVLAQPDSPFPLARGFSRLKILWRSVIWRTLVTRVRRKRKALSVRETSALGDRRFVSVIQFEQRRFLVGSSPSSVTLLAELTDEPQNGESESHTNNNESGENN